MNLTLEQQNLIRAVRQGIQSDRQMNPFLKTDRWYTRFEKANTDWQSLNEAPLNVPLMVITESLGTLYMNNRGGQVSRSSVIVRVTEN